MILQQMLKQVKLLSKQVSKSFIKSLEQLYRPLNLIAFRVLLAAWKLESQRSFVFIFIMYFTFIMYYVFVRRLILILGTYL